MQGIQLRREGPYLGTVLTERRIRKRKVEVVASNLLPFTGTERQHRGCMRC